MMIDNCLRFCRAMDLPRSRPTYIGGALVAALATSYLVKNVYKRVQIRKNGKKIKNKRADLAARKRRLENSLLVDGVLLTPERQRIVEKDINQLLSQLKSGQLRPITVLEAFQAAALSVDKEINAVCDFILEARDWALQLETVPETERGALYGLPFSVKECFNVSGYDCTMGLAQLIGRPATRDSSFVSGMKELHAVPFCLTNIPQTMVSWSCSNPVYGNTLNPHDHSRTPGGSSGGEAALIAGGGSVLGLGTDIGGSLRIPAHFTGICGFKPTNGRLYEDGRVGAVGSGMSTLRSGVYSVAGFMSPDVAGIQVGMKSLLASSRAMSARDWRVVPVDWTEELYKPGRKLRLAYYEEDGIFPPTPGAQRALKEVLAALKADGHQVVPWAPMDFVDAFDVFSDLIFADKGFNFNRTMKYEIIDKAIETNAWVFGIPVVIRDIVAYFVSFVSMKIAKFLYSGVRTSAEMWTTNARKDKIIYKMMREWEEKQFDAIITLASPLPAISPDVVSSLISGACYTAVYNLTGCPAGILPVTKVNEEDEAKLDSFPLDYPIGYDSCNKVAREASRGALGCPLGVQVVGRHYQEEMVLHVMETIEKLVKYHK